LPPWRPCDTKIAANQLQGYLMAIDPSGGHPDMDYAEHRRTYAGFVRATIMMIVFVALTLLFMLFFLVP
jgi:Bacterial aa3 type cytochrome c oxidase subunit IV